MGKKMEIEVVQQDISQKQHTRKIPAFRRDVVDDRDGQDLLQLTPEEAIKSKTHRKNEAIQAPSEPSLGALVGEQVIGGSQRGRGDCARTQKWRGAPYQQWTQRLSFHPGTVDAASRDEWDGTPKPSRAGAVQAEWTGCRAGELLGSVAALQRLPRLSSAARERVSW